MKDQQPRNLHEEEHTGTPGFVPGQPEMAFPPLLSLASLLDFSPDALLVIDATGTIVLLNAQLETLFGYDQGELIGQPLEVLLPERLRTAHIAQRLHYLSAPRARPMGIGLNLVGRRKDGGEFPVDISLRPLLIGQVLHVMGAIRDMTAQRLAEQERVQLTERLQRQDQLLNFSHDAILVRDPQSRIISWNRGAQELYGWKEHEAVVSLRKATWGWLRVVFLRGQLFARVLRAHHQQWQPGGTQDTLGNAAHHPAGRSAPSMGGQRDEITTVHHPGEAISFPCLCNPDQRLSSIQAGGNR
jgi:PAS domain S-box-containing protein